MKCNSKKKVPSKSRSHVHHISKIHMFPVESSDITFYNLIPIFWLCLEKFFSGKGGIHSYALESIWWIMKAYRPWSDISSITILRQSSYAWPQTDIPAKDIDILQTSHILSKQWWCSYPMFKSDGWEQIEAAISYAQFIPRNTGPD